jgi:hypothetical protein
MCGSACHVTSASPADSAAYSTSLGVSNLVPARRGARSRPRSNRAEDSQALAERKPERSRCVDVWPGAAKLIPRIECSLRVAQWPQRAMIEAPCLAPRSLCRRASSRYSTDRPTGHCRRGVSRLPPAAPAVSLPGPPASSRPLPESRAGSRAAAPVSRRSCNRSACRP